MKPLGAWKLGVLVMSCVLGLSGLASAAELVLYSIPARRGISWKSPRALLLSRLKNELNFRRGPKHKLGHVAVELTSKSGHFLTGMTDTGEVSYKHQVFKEGYGLGVTTESVPGRLQRPDEVGPDLQRRFKDGSVTYMRFLISDESAARVADYITQFEQKGYDQRYGGSLRPRHKEGSGCSAFGASCMSVAGVLDPKMSQSWLKDVRLPGALVGGPDTGRKVPVLELLFSQLASRWAHKGEEGERLHIYDPGAIATWITAQHDALKAGSATKFGMKLVAEQVGKAKGLLVDARDVPTPTDALFVGPEPKQ